MLLQSFQPMTAQLSKKAALPLATIFTTASCRSSKTGPCDPITSKYCLKLDINNLHTQSALLTGEFLFLWGYSSQLSQHKQQTKRPSSINAGNDVSMCWIPTLIARFMGPTCGPSRADRTQVGPMLAPWTLLSGKSTGRLGNKEKQMLCGYLSHKKSSLVNPEAKLLICCRSGEWIMNDTALKLKYYIRQKLYQIMGYLFVKISQLLQPFVKIHSDSNTSTNINKYLSTNAIFACQTHIIAEMETCPYEKNGTDDHFTNN